MVDRNSPEYVKKLELAYLKSRSDNQKWSEAYTGALELQGEWQRAYEALNIRHGDLKYRLGRFIQRLEALGLKPTGIDEKDPGKYDTKALKTLDYEFEGFILGLGRRLDEQVVGEELKQKVADLNLEYTKLKKESDEAKKEGEDKLRSLIRRTNSRLEQYDKQFEALIRSTKNVISQKERELIEARRAQLEALAERGKGVLENLLGEEIELDEVEVIPEPESIDGTLLHKLNSALAERDKAERSRKSLQGWNTKYRKQLEDYTLLRKGIVELGGIDQEAIDTWLAENRDQ